MTTATKTRKPARTVTIGTPVNGTFALAMTIGAGAKSQHFGYYLTRIPADFGLGFHFEKFRTEQVEGEPSNYDVNIDLQHGFHTCDCLGHQKWDHCKHVEAILALIKSGKLTVPAAKPQAQPVATDTDLDDL